MKVVIPTRNRPTSLQGVLDYYARFYPQVDLLVADGSAPEFKERNAEVAAAAGIAVDYRPYDETLSLFDRLLEVLRTIDSEYVVMGADDDYPVMETMVRAQRRLEEKPDAVAAGGHLVHIGITSPDDGIVRLDPVRHISADTPDRRMRMFGALPFTTTYGVARRELLVHRYEFLREWSMPGFFDLGVGLMDLSHGKFIAIPDLGFICTRNYVHSYYRAEEPLVYLRRAHDVLDLHDRLLERLSHADGLDPDTAADAVRTVISRRVAALAGAPPYRLAGFTERPPYNTPIVEGARQLFADLFRAGTPERAKHAERLEFIAARLAETLESTDNAGEADTYESW
ncbi:TIGR00180 family glycosyltransferase [Nocardioides stalactiti]|uniref:TIGR00180 family glycosyltransferase n=1 Tax=Nocardioides stalactiti TaxID=2755356 RepID=UPI0015FF549C|nr:TIGR00180 family glycosyltransferase [Nocardioides stalactiti]